MIDPYLGVGDAWAVVRAADAAWDGTSGDWVSLEAADSRKYERGQTLQWRKQHRKSERGRRL